MQFQSIDFVTRALFQVLPSRLLPYLQGRLRAEGIENTWHLVFEEQDRRNRRPGRSHELTDPAVQLKLLFYQVASRRLIPGSDAVADQARAVLRVRNVFAHPRGPVRREDAAAVLLQVKTLFAHLELEDAADEIDELLGELSRIGDTPRESMERDQPTGEDQQSDTGGDDEESDGIDVLEDEVAEAPDVSESPMLDGPEAQAARALNAITVEIASGFPRGENFATAADHKLFSTLKLQVTVNDVLPVLRISTTLRTGTTVLSDTVDVVVSSKPGEPQQFPAALRLDRAALLGIDQIARAELHVILSAAGIRRTIVLAGSAVHLLGPRNWALSSSERDHALLGFVQPQQPVLAGLQREAGAILEKATGDGALNANQGSVQRTLAVVDALCRAVHGRDLTYANPPASWVNGTQRIRSAEEVLSDRIATCLDSSMLLASLMEQSRINAQLWLLPGHIFIGVWASDERPDLGTLQPDPGVMTNSIDKGDLVLIETTMLTSSVYPGLFALHTGAREHLMRADVEARTSASDVGAPAIQVLDIRRARIDGHYPNPVRATDPDGDTTVIPYVAPERDIARLVRETHGGKGRTAFKDTDVPARVEAWKRELLDLSLNNRLINLNVGSAPDLAVPSAFLPVFEDMLHAGTQFTLVPGGRKARTGLPGGADGPSQDGPEPVGDRGSHDPERLIRDVFDEQSLTDRLVDDHRLLINLSPEHYARNLQKLANTARTVVEETGANNLYLTLGTLRWNLEGKSLVSPLVLVPVTIRPRAKGREYVLSLDDTGSSTPNHSLLQRLAHDLDLRIPGLEDPESDGSGIDLAKAFDAVRTALIDHRLGFRVEPDVRLGLLAFGTYRLWKDLEENWRSIVANPLVGHLVESPAEPFEDPAGPAEERDLDRLVAQLPTTADSSQAAVIAEAVAGRTIVVEGPPGTGKSQTITNLIVQAMVEGKRVLFVAEKQAALEVVNRRLHAAGVSDLVLNLHDTGLKPTAVKTKIRSALDLRAEYDEEGLAADRRALEARRRDLVRYRDAMHARNSTAMSLYSAHTADLARGEDVAPLDVPVSVVPTLRPEVLEAVRAGLAEAVSAAHAVTARPDHPWRVLGGPLSPGTESAVFDAVTALHGQVTATPAELQHVVRSLRTSDEARGLAGLVGDVALPWELADAVVEPRWDQATRTVEADLDALDALSTPVFSVYDPAVVLGPLDQVRASLSEARTAMMGRRGRMRRAVAPLARWERPGASVPDADLENAVNELLVQRDRALRLATQLDVVPGLPSLPPPAVFDPAARAHVRGVVRHLRSVRDARRTVDPAMLDEVARIPGQHRVQAALWLVEIARRWDDVRSATGRPWGDAYDEAPLVALTEALGRARQGEATPRGLALWAGLERSVDPLRPIGLGSVARQILDGTIDPSDIPLAFEKGLARASFQERLEVGNLRTFDGSSHDRAIDSFEVLSGRVRDGANAAVRARILAHRDLHSTPASRRRSSDLRREVSGRSRAMRIRPLIEKYGEVVSRSMPCVLVSPDSAARFIPLGDPIFDIVVFDEASQITVPSAVGAMGRGRSVVVVGDSRQMPPTRFAQITGSEDDSTLEDGTVRDEESILGECVSARVERHWLSHHYRSRSEDLIAFSNERYYEGRLSTFPGPEAGTVTDDDVPGSPRAGVHMRRVDGTFLRGGAPKGLLRTNPVEADAVVEEIRRRFEGAAEPPSIGVVTFNMPQRDLVESKLRELGDDAVLESLDDPEGLFVKNLENVQGDERDVIVFSIAFSADAGGQVPLNFGPLNREGGERRLNVAVTRARAEVLVICSFDPSQLHAERSASTGLKDLRDYLDLAHRGAATTVVATGAAAAVDRHREDVAAALRARGLQVRTGLGLSQFRVDLGVGPEGGDLVLAIMLDGPSWAHRTTTVDRDLLPRTVLSGVAGWPAVERVWLLDWVDRRGAVVDRLVARVEEVVAEVEAERLLDAATPDPTEDAEVDARPEVPSGEFDPAEAVLVTGDPHGSDQRADPTHDDLPTPAEADIVRERILASRTELPDTAPPADAWGVPEPPVRAAEAPAALADPTAGEVRDPASTSKVRPWRYQGGAGIELLDSADTDPGSADALTRLLVEATAQEYPVHRAEIARRVIAGLGMQKVRSTRVDAFWQVVDRSRVRVDDDEYVWPLSVQPEEFTGYRGSLLTTRSVEDVHPQELRNVAAAVRGAGPGTGQEQRLRAAMRILGAGRLTTNLRGALLRADEDADRDSV